jgi:inner membrane protein
VTLGLLIALESVSGIVSEREGRLREAEREVASSLATQQAVLGPAVQRRCVETWTSISPSERRTVTEQHRLTLQVVPRTLQVVGDARIETRHRGLFKVNGYAAKAQLVADWAPLGPMQPAAEHPGGVVRCEAPELVVAVSDVRGIRTATIQVGDQTLTTQPDSRHAGQPNGFHAVLPTDMLSDQPLHAEVSLELLGTGSFAVAPLGESTRVQLQSDWPHPSFAGRFLPARSAPRVSQPSGR